VIESAADAAFEAVTARLDEVGATVDLVYIALRAKGLPEGERDTVTAAAGNDLPDDPADAARDVVLFLVSSAAGTASQIGLDLRIVPLTGGEG
jgi:hypothetical protein